MWSLLMQISTFRLYTASLHQAMRPTGYASPYKTPIQDRIKENDRDIRLTCTPASAVSEHAHNTGHHPRPHRLMKTSSKQSKRRDIHPKWQHRETNDNTLLLLYFTTMDNYNLFLRNKKNVYVFTFSWHAARSLGNNSRFDWIKPVNTADHIFSFTRLYLRARLSW